MDPILAIDLVKDALSDFVRRVGSDFIAPLDGLENLGAFVAVKYGGALGCEDLFVGVRPDDQRVNRCCGLSDGIEVTRMAEIVTPIDESSVRLILTGDLLVRLGAR